MSGRGVPAATRAPFLGARFAFKEVNSLSPAEKQVLIDTLLRLVSSNRITRGAMDAFWYKRVLHKAPPDHVTYCLPASDDPVVDAAECAARHVERELDLWRKEHEEAPGIKRVGG